MAVALGVAKRGAALAIFGLAGALLGCGHGERRGSGASP